MVIDDKHVIRALRFWNSWQNPWTAVKTFGQLTEDQKARVLSIAQDLAVAENDFVCTTEENYV